MRALPPSRPVLAAALGRRGFTEIRSQRIPDRETGVVLPSSFSAEGPSTPGGVRAPTPETRCTGSPARGRGPGRACATGAAWEPWKQASGEPERRSCGDGPRDSGVRKPSSPRGPNKLDRVREQRGWRGLGPTATLSVTPAVGEDPGRRRYLGEEVCYARFCLLCLARAEVRECW